MYCDGADLLPVRGYAEHREGAVKGHAAEAYILLVSARIEVGGSAKCAGRFCIAGEQISGLVIEFRVRHIADSSQPGEGLLSCLFIAEQQRRSHAFCQQAGDGFTVVPIVIPQGAVHIKAQADHGQQGDQADDQQVDRL